MALFFHMYWIESGADESILWNPNEVFIFVHGEHHGYRVSYLGYVAGLTKSYFGVVSPPDDNRPFTTLVRITPSGVERYSVSEDFDFFTPHGSDIYAWKSGSGLWKWEGTHFEKATVEEQQELGNQPNLPKRDFAGVNGWSGHFSAASGIKVEPPVKVGAASLVLDDGNGQLSPSVEGRHYADQRLFYSHDGHPQRVSRSEYQSIFNHD